MFIVSLNLKATVDIGTPSRSRILLIYKLKIHDKLIMNKDQQPEAQMTKGTNCM